MMESIGPLRLHECKKVMYIEIQVYIGLSDVSFSLHVESAALPQDFLILLNVQNSLRVAEGLLIQPSTIHG